MGADLSRTNLGILWHLKMHRGCFGMDYFGSSGVCGMFQIVCMFEGPEGDGRFQYKRGIKFSTAKGLNKERRDPATISLAPLLLLRLLIYLYS